MSAPVSVAYNAWTEFQEWTGFMKKVEKADAEDDTLANETGGGDAGTDADAAAADAPSDAPRTDAGADTKLLENDRYDTVTIASTFQPHECGVVGGNGCIQLCSDGVYRLHLCLVGVIAAKEFVPAIPRQRDGHVLARQLRHQVGRKQGHVGKRLIQVHDQLLEQLVQVR